PVDDGVDLFLRNPRSLDALGTWLLGGDDQHVSHADQLLGSGAIDDHSTVCLRGDRERQPGRDVGLDDAGDHIDRRALGGDHEVDPHCACHLGDTHDGFFDLATCHHHQVVELVDDHHHIREAVETFRIELPPVPLLEI